MFPGPGLGFGRGIGFGRGFGRGMGIGRGRGFGVRWFQPLWGYPYPPVNPDRYPLSREQEQAVLSDQAEVLQGELQRVQQRLKELRKVKEEKKDAKSP
jgi:hypothetical protein